MAAGEVVAEVVMVVEEGVAVVGEEEGVEVGEEVDGTEDMQVMEDMVDTEEREGGTSISFDWYSLAFIQCDQHVVIHMNSVFSVSGRKHFFIQRHKKSWSIMLVFSTFFFFFFKLPGNTVSIINTSSIAPSLHVFSHRDTNDLTRAMTL